MAAPDAPERGKNFGKKLWNVLDNMLEGFQIIDYDWRYVYLNDAAAKYGRSTKKDLIGKTMMEAYPGIEKTDTFLGLPSFDIDTLLRAINKAAERVDARRVVVDPISSLLIQYRDPFIVRRETLSLIRSLSQDEKCTSLFLSEVSKPDSISQLNVETFLTNGVIILHNIKQREKNQSRRDTQDAGSEPQHQIASLQNHRQRHSHLPEGKSLLNMNSLSKGGSGGSAGI